MTIKAKKIEILQLSISSKAVGRHDPELPVMMEVVLSVDGARVDVSSVRNECFLEFADEWFKLKPLITEITI